MRRFTRYAAFALPVLTLLTLCACQDRRASQQAQYDGPGGPLSGQVTFKGESVDAGYVVIRSAEVAEAAGAGTGGKQISLRAPIKDGRYHFDRAPVGEVEFRLDLPWRADRVPEEVAEQKRKLAEKLGTGQQLQKRPKSSTPEDFDKLYRGADPGYLRTLKLAQHIPLRYKSFERARLNTTVQENQDNVFDISLTDEPNAGRE